MKFINKALLTLGALAAVAVPVGTAVASSASASVGAPAVVQAYHAPVQLGHTLKLVYQGNTYTYQVEAFTQQDGVVHGWLFDPYLAAQHNPGISGWLRINGDVTGKTVVFDVQYPTTVPADQQGLRGFTGTIAPVPGHPFQHVVTGVWDETGTEAGTGTFTLS